MWDAIHFFPSVSAKARVSASARSAPDPVGLAHTARLFTGGPSCRRSPPEPCASWLATPPQWVLLTAPRRVMEHRRCPSAQRRPTGPTDAGLVPSPRPPPHHCADKRALKGSFAGGSRARGKGLCLFWLSVLVNWRVSGQITFQSNRL